MPSPTGLASVPKLRAWSVKWKPPAFGRSLKADTGHFALEEEAPFMIEKMESFLDKNIR